MISIVCPFYNEETILEKSIELMLRNLDSLQEDWELIIVNDGSIDHSLEIARKFEKENPKLRVVSYETNQGRGNALLTGIRSAKGDIIVTTELDCSWGDHVVQELVQALKTNPKADMVIASPNLPGGGYKNVPLRRVMISRFGNLIIRAGQGNNITMYTGMTRAYRKDKILKLPLNEKGKEFHLEVASKAKAFGFNVIEIPTTLEWKDKKLSNPSFAPRKSSSKIPKLIMSHTLFSLITAPFRYIFPITLALGFFGVVFFGLAVYNLFNPEPSIFYFITSCFLFLFAFLCAGVGVLSYQGHMILKELWMIRSKQMTDRENKNEQ